VSRLNYDNLTGVMATVRKNNVEYKKKSTRIGVLIFNSTIRNINIHSDPVDSPTQEMHENVLLLTTTKCH